MPFNFGPPVIDFSPLGKLGETYDAGVKRNREAEMNAARQKALAGFGQNGDLAALGQTLLRSGDLEGGMAALRFDAANKGTPWQREQAAAEAGRAASTLEETRRQHDREEEYRKRTEERTTRPERIQGKDEFGDPKYGDRDPVTGEIKWDDGTTTPGRGSRGPQSGGPDDPNLPQPNAAAAQLALSPQTSTDPGYVIPKTLQGFPPGTTLPPGGLAALAPPAGATETAIAAPAAATAAPLAPPGATGPTAVAQSPAAPAPPAAAPGQPTVPGAPVTATQISQGTANIPPMTAREMIDEAHRLGISPGQYRAARAEAIKRELEAKSGGGEKLTEAQANSRIYAGAMEGAEKEFRPNEGDSYSVGQHVLGSLPIGKAANYFTSAKYQAATNAKKEWVAAFLRKTSGAAVSPIEFDMYNEIYFPQPGDDANVVAQKARARERALQGLKAGLPPAELKKMETEGGVGPAPGRAGDLGSGTSLTTKSGIKASW